MFIQWAKQLFQLNTYNTGHLVSKLQDYTTNFPNYFLFIKDHTSFLANPFFFQSL